MHLIRPALRRLSLAVVTTVMMGCAASAQSFPVDQVLVLDVRPIGSVKRVPSMTVESDGRATIDLWCKTVPARLSGDGATLQIATAPLPEALPLYMSSGQCSPERMQADVDLLAALTQVSGWERQGDRVTFMGPEGSTPLRFRVSSH